MDKITQAQVAKFLGVSDAYLCQFRSGQRTFGKHLAKEISEQTGISINILAFENGERPYQMLVLAYEQSQRGLL